jgi:hypothetical protein
LIKRNNELKWVFVLHGCSYVQEKNSTGYVK